MLNQVIICERTYFDYWRLQTRVLNLMSSMRNFEHLVGTKKWINLKM